MAHVGPYLLRVALLLSGDLNHAEDLVQTTFERTYRSWGRARDTDPRAYARKVLVNLRIDRWRRARREVLASPDTLPQRATPSHADAVDGRNEVVRALAALPPAQRRVVVLRHLLDLTESETARELALGRHRQVPQRTGSGPVANPAYGRAAVMDPPPGPGEWPRDVDRLERDVMPVVEELHVYLLHPGPCRVLEYDRGDYRDGDPEDCGDLVPFDAQARADFDRMTDAIERSGVAVERIRRDRGAIYIPLEDYSRQYKLGVRVPARCRHTARHDVARGAMDAHPR